MDAGAPTLYMYGGQAGVPCRLILLSVITSGLQASGVHFQTKAESHTHQL